MKIWSWRQAVQKSELPATTKLVLLNLSIYMNEVGEGCYPSIEQQCQDCSLSNRAIITHLDKAVEAGFLEKKKHGFSGQKWMRNEYEACYPKGSEPHAKAVNLTTKGSEPHDIKAVNEVHTNTPENSPMNKKGAHIDLDYPVMKEDFEEFYTAYPKHEGYELAFEEYRKVIKLGYINPDDLLAKAKSYARKKHGQEDFALQPRNWLANQGWKDEIAVAKKGTNAGKNAEVKAAAGRMLLGMFDGSGQSLVKAHCDKNGLGWLKDLAKEKGRDWQDALDNCFFFLKDNQQQGLTTKMWSN